MADHDVRQNMKYRGTVRIGANRIRWPFGTLQIDNEGVLLAGLGLRCVLKKNEIRRIEYQDSYFSEGLRFAHSNSVHSPDIFFRTSDPEDIISLARELGYSTIST